MIVEVPARPSALETRAATHDALADPIRVAIVDELAATDRTPGELGRLTGVPSNLLAYHLRTLEQRGLVERRRSIGDGRRAYVRLRAERLDGLVPRPRISSEAVLFVCTANSARSQLAAAMWNKGPWTARADSAGTHPATRVHPAAVRAARRRGLDLSRAVPRAVGDDTMPGTLIVTVCDQAREELGDRVAIHWSVADPARVGTPEAFDAAADEIARRVTQLGDVVTPSIAASEARPHEEVG